MKKILLSLVAVVLMIANVNAQETSFGVRLGSNLANIGGDDTEDVKMKIGFNLGAYVNFGLSERISLEPGLFLSTKGYKYEESGTDDFGAGEFSYEDKTKYTSTYLDLPVLLRINVVSGLNLFVGPQISYLVGNKYKSEYSVTVNGETETEEYSDDSTDGINKLDLGLAFGVGYQLENGLNFNLGYDLGLSNLYDSEDDDDDDKISNRVIKLSVGFSF